MEITVDFPGGVRVDAHFGSFTVQTDQPKERGGENTAPAPFDLFLVSLATCAGAYVQEFCNKRRISTAGIQLVQQVEWDSKGKMITRISIDIQLPGGFPSQYTAAVKRAADLCLVKRHLEIPPAFDITVSVAR